MGEDEVTACSREAGLHPTTPQEEQGLLQKGPCLPQHIHALEAHWSRSTVLILVIWQGTYNSQALNRGIWAGKDSGIS